MIVLLSMLASPRENVQPSLNSTILIDRPASRARMAASLSTCQRSVTEE